MPTISDSVRASKQYKQYQRILTTIRESFDPVSIEKEAKMLHASRPSRHMDPKKISPKMLIEANMKDIANRSRFVELRVSLGSYQTALETTITAVRRYLISELGDQTERRTREERKQYFDRYFKEGESVLAETGRLTDMLDLFIRDIDQASFGMRHLVTLLEMIYAPERAI